MIVHTLKCDPAPFQAVVDGRKTCEIRRDDRDFKPGDIVCLMETDVARVLYTGRRLYRSVLHVLHAHPDYGLQSGYVALSLSLQDVEPPKPVPGPTVESLQRELLALARGGKAYDSWARVNGTTTTPNLRRELGNLSRINELRDQIRAIDPNAALYYGWGGHGDQPRESKKWHV